MKKITVVRGYPGSGKSQLAQSLAGHGQVISQDRFMAPLEPGQDIFTSYAVGHAYAELLTTLRETLEQGVTPLVVDLIASRLWEVREILQLAEAAGYEVEVCEPETDWARKPKECQKRTQFPLMPETWEWLVLHWQPTTSQEGIRNALSPDERLGIAKWIAAMADRFDGQDRADRERFLLENFGNEAAELIRTGFIGVEGSARRKAYRDLMVSKGIPPPNLVELPASPSIGSEIEDLLARRDRTTPRPPIEPDIN